MTTTHRTIILLLFTLTVLAPSPGNTATLGEIRTRWDAVREEIRQRTPANEETPGRLFRVLDKVNREVNTQIAYTSDQKLYGREDYFATPWESLKRKKGDCEDIAAVKYQRLLSRGVPAGAMSIELYRAEGLIRGLNDTDHAVLVVRDGGREYVLDNRFNQIQNRSVLLGMTLAARLD